MRSRATAAVASVRSSICAATARTRGRCASTPRRSDARGWPDREVDSDRGAASSLAWLSRGDGHCGGVALSASEAVDLLTRVRHDPTAVKQDLPDFLEFMFGTDVRIGEAAAVREAVVDPATGAVHMNATVVPVNGAGLEIQPHVR